MSKPYEDHVCLTTKHLICKFNYFMFSYDKENEESGINKTENYISKGFINFTPDYFNDNDILISNANNHYFNQIVNELKQWHKQIIKVEINFANIKEIDNISENIKYDHVIQYINEIGDTNITKENIEKIFTLKNIIISVDVYFHLISNIKSIDDFGINFEYLHHLLKSKIFDFEIQLDEIPIKKTMSMLPFYEGEPDDYNDKEEPIYYVNPIIKFIPLHKYKKY